MYYDLLANLTTTMQLLTGRGGTIIPITARAGGGRLIDLLHLRAAIVVVLDREAELDHAVDARGERGGLVEREAQREERGLEEEVDEVLDRLVALVRRRLRLELLHDRVLRVDLHRLLRRHVRRHRVVAERLRAHDPLHVRRPAVLAGDEAARRLREALRDDDLLRLVAEDLLHQLAQRLEVGLDLLERLLLLLRLLELEALLRHREELLAVVLLELLDAVLVDRVDHEEHLVVALLAALDERRRLHLLLRLAGDVVDVSKRRWTRSLTVLSPLFAADFALSSFMIECFGLISIVFFDAMYDDIELSRSACARMIRSMLAVQPYSPVTRQHGASERRSETTTFSVLSPRISFISLHSGSKSALISSNAFFSSSVSSHLRPSFVTESSFLPSYSLSCCTQYSSIGSTMKSTS